MHYTALRNKGDYIAASEFGTKEPTLTILSAQLVRLEQEDGREKEKGVIRFKETDRGWVLNRTNLELLAALLGVETDQWAGKRVTLFAQPVKFGGKTELGIRVKGSPELDAPKVVTVKLPRRRPTEVTLVPTAKAGSK